MAEGNPRRPGSRKKLGLAIRHLREEQGLTQEDLATSIDRSSPTVSKIEAGTHPMDHDTIEKVAKALGVSYLRLIWNSQREQLQQSPDYKKFVPVFDAFLSEMDG